MKLMTQTTARLEQILILARQCARRAPIRLHKQNFTISLRMAPSEISGVPDVRIPTKHFCNVEFKFFPSFWWVHYFHTILSSNSAAF